MTLIEQLNVSERLLIVTTKVKDFIAHIPEAQSNAMDSIAQEGLPLLPQHTKATLEKAMLKSPWPSLGTPFAFHSSWLK
uniref:Uncharacterized protein n=1 Tax=Steinernema glaseri TaxID=37863 RepID=A0A1I7Y811_9BILA